MANSRLLVPLVVLIMLPGCALSRHQELKRESRRVESRLQSEQALALETEYANIAERDERLGHLTSLRYTLSAADLGLASVPRLVPEDQRPLAYDVLEEVYSTIDWNIPLGPGDELRPLPDVFSGGALDLGALTRPTERAP